MCVWDGRIPIPSRPKSRPQGLDIVGFVTVRVDGPRRWYRLRAEPLAELDRFVAAVGIAVAGRFVGAGRRHVEQSRRLLRIPGVTRRQAPPTTSLGVKGIGEGGAIGTPAAVANAVCRATGLYGANLLLAAETADRSAEAPGR